MHFKAKFRRLVDRVNLSDPATWEDPKAAKVAIDASQFLSDEDRRFLTAIFGPLDREGSSFIFSRYGGMYLTITVQTLIIDVRNMYRSDKISCILALKRALTDGSVFTHDVEHSYRAGRKGVDEILIFLGLRK